jgi:hypothetical protein
MIIVECACCRKGKGPANVKDKRGVARRSGLGLHRFARSATSGSGLELSEM